MLDGDTCYRALEAKDARFDGLFFVGVSTTGIYCRPVCRARTPRRERCTFHRSGAEAERAGFRACLRCRPELAAGSAPIDSIPRIVARALARIDEVASGDLSLEALAAALDVSDRHLRRAIEAQLGVSPIELVTSRRLAMAKQLLHDTRLGLAEIAFASGFGSVRRFNAAFRARFERAPSSLRRALVPRDGSAPEGATLTLRLGYRPPFDWAALLRFLGGRAIPGVERVEGERYLRTVRAGDGAGVIAVRDDPERSLLIAELPLALAGAVMPIAARLRALFDLDADPARIEAG
ncbi:MAG: helix-turn-helix domain-containing protein, partial [Myxococcota bacterium]|nr:helix-turn-helix domain-containing protein [Myxococcota bacterium]